MTASHELIEGTKKLLKSAIKPDYATIMEFTEMGLTECLTNSRSLEPMRTEQAMGNRILLFPRRY